MEQPESTEKTLLIDEKYKILRSIIKGNNSQVFLVEKLCTKEKYAMKLIKNKGILYHLLLNDIRNELSCLRQLEHDQLIKLVDHNLQGEMVKPEKKKSRKVSYLILEYAENGEIFQFLKKTRGFPIPIVKFYFKQLLEGVLFMHKEGIFHRDLKLENLLLDKDFNLKIIDYGYATQRPTDNKVLGTDFYMPPEMVTRRDYECSKCDVFSLGVILFAFIRGNFPFKAASSSDNNYKFFYQGKEAEFWKIFAKTRFTEDAIDLLSRLLSSDPLSRPSVEEILGSDFLKQGLPDSKTVYEFMRKIKI